jgi:hypothetical protein
MKVSELSYLHQQAIEAMKSQLLIVLINRLGGTAEIPVEEIDGTGAFKLAMKLCPITRTFTFSVLGKNETLPPE